MELAIYDISGKETGKKALLKDEIFAIEPNDHAIWLDVKQYMANQRQGTHKARQRNEVAGSTKKLKRQKGTGGARAGSIKSPLFPGGGRIFGPVPRDYSFKLNKKLKALARRSALAYKAKGELITMVEDFTIAEPKTKTFIGIADALKLGGKKMLVITAQSDHNVILSTRNLPNVKVVVASDVNTYDLMNTGVIVMTEGAANVINEQLA
jgi:large subunit ribosomal protein L4